jgi:glyoxylase-like metal-dependent hydrolase (beta-lactamase superfamily II)
VETLRRWLSFSAIVAGLVAFIWWVALDSRAPASSPGVIDLAGLRGALEVDSPENLPTSVRLHKVGSGEAPMLAVETGGGFGKFRIAYTAFEITYPDGHIMVDAAVDRETAQSITSKDKLQFSDAAYDLLLKRMGEARMILLTHEHKDHVMAFARHPALPSLIAKAWLTKAQSEGLRPFARTVSERALLMQAATKSLYGVQRIAPGIAVAPLSGHSPGSLVSLVRLRSGREYLFIGDVAWSFSNILKLKTRPRFLQWIMFDPDEERDDVLGQIRALHDIHQANPDLIIVPSHDAAYLDRLTQGKLLADAGN